MIVIICSISARGITQITYDGYKYSIDEATRTAAVDRQNNTSLQSVTIPSTVYYDGQGYTVTAIADYAFNNCRQLTTVSLPSTITSIGDYAFGSCSELVSINIPEGVTTIGCDVFYYCKKLANVTLPSTLTSLGQWAFANCSSLTGITIPNGLKTIENYTFWFCSNLQKVTLPNSITSIGQNAFSNCSQLESINLANGITSIGISAFSWCEKLTNITLPAKLKKIENSAFSCCRSLTSVTIPDEVRSIADNAFGACSSLKSITISKQVTSISPTAFSNCKLASITVADGNPVYDSRQSCNAIIETATNRLILGTALTVIPNNIVEIGAHAFSGCNDLTSVELPSTVRIIGLEAFSSCYGLQEIKLNEGLAEIGIRAFSGCSGITSINIPKSVHYIGGQAFQGCQKLNTFEWPASLSNISDSVFQNCTALTTFTVPETVKRIGKASFMGCTGLVSIQIPSTVTSIDDEAFYDCDNLTSFELPANVTKLGKKVFAYCDNLATLTVAEGNPVYDSREGCNAIIETESNTLIMATHNTTVPSTVTAIGDYAFQASKVSNLTLPKGLTYIGEQAFSYCQNITTLVLPEGLQTLSSSAFFASKLESISLPSTLREVGANTFYHCPSLKTVVLPASIEKLGSWAFMSCNNVTDYYCYRATPPLFELLAIQTFTATLHVPAAAVDAYRADANWGNFSKIVPINEGDVTYSYDPATLTATLISYTNSGKSEVIVHSTTIYDGQIYQVKHIDNSVFGKHSKMQSIALPDSLVTIGASTFNTCTSLRKITLPASVRSLGSNVFSGCKSLTDIYSFALVMPETEGDIINNAYLSHVTLHVPLYLMQQYRQHEVWGKFGNIVPLESVGMPKTYLEYFVDEDPGLGRGRRIMIDKTDGDFSYTLYSEYEYMYEQSFFHTGINNLGMRIVSVYNDGTTTYSPTDRVQLYKSIPVGKTNSTVSYVEYFWDEDPGYGKGTPLSFTIDNNDVIVDTEIEQGKLRGEHTLFVRARSGDTWSIIEAQTVVLQAAGPLSGLIVLDPTVTENQDEGKFNLLSTLLSALSTRGFDIGLNVNVADATYNFVVSEQSIAVVQALYQYLIKMNFYISMKAPNSATFNFIIPQEFMYLHQEELPQIAAAVQAMFSHIVTENISVLIDGQAYQYDGFQVEPNDMMALKNVYNRLNGENWTQKKWSFRSNGRDASEFPGVEFNTQGRVTSINLYNNNLNGILTDEWHLEMPYLTYLNLSYNDIEGDLSPFLRYTTGLKSLYMTNNCLTEISDTLPSSLTTIDLKYQFKTGYSNSELKEMFLEKQQPRRFYISNKQQLNIPSLFTYNHKYMDHSATPTVYLLDRTSSHNSFAYYTNQYGFAWKSSEEYTDVQDARYLVELSGGTGISSNSVVPMYVRYVVGDANMSGATDVLDVQHTLNHILGSVWNFNYSAANTYTDKTINVQDIVCTVNIILAQEQSTVASSRGEQEVNTPEAWLYTRDGQLVLATSKEVGAIDVELSGVSTSQVSLLLNHSHFQMIGRNTEYGARFVIFSPTGQAIPAGELNALLRLSSHAEIVTAQIADITADEVNVVLGSEPTSIGQVRDGMMAARFQGNQLFINTTSEMNNVELRLTSTSGAVLFSTELSHVVRGETTLNVNVVPGVYVLELTNAVGARKIVKLIKR